MADRYTTVPNGGVIARQTAIWRLIGRGRSPFTGRAHELARARRLVWKATAAALSLRRNLQTSATLSTCEVAAQAQMAMGATHGGAFGSPG